MDAATTTTFEVSGVWRATTPLPELPYKQAVEALLTIGFPEQDRRMGRGHGEAGIPIDLPSDPGVPARRSLLSLPWPAGGRRDVPPGRRRRPHGLH